MLEDFSKSKLFILKDVLKFKIFQKMLLVMKLICSWMCLFYAVASFTVLIGRQ
jgi:hypothetical protein